MIYLSHSGGRRDDPDWWIVEPGAHEHVIDEVKSLLSRNRRVVALEIGEPAGDLVVGHAIEIQVIM